MTLLIQEILGNSNPKHWLGKIGIGYGVGYFEGLTGDNQLHRHHAHQLSFSKSPQHLISINTDQGRLQGEDFFIAADTAHQLEPNYYCSIYIDRTHYLAQHLISQHPQDGVQQFQHLHRFHVF